MAKLKNMIVGNPLKMQDLGLCPCGQGIAACEDPPTVAHSLPECPAFSSLEPDEFLAYVRKSRGIADDGSLIAHHS